MVEHDEDRPDKLGRAAWNGMISYSQKRFGVSSERDWDRLPAAQQMREGER